jgi:enoyl-CoA hydratase/methylglutaconyl-CoA hydratase
VRIGLVTRAVPAEQLDEAVAEVTSQWAGTSAQGLRETKALLNDSVLRRIDDLGEQVARQSAQLFASEEARAAMQAFLSRTR